MQHRRLQGYGLVLVAAVLWATIGLWYHYLIDAHGLARQTVVAYRAGLAGLGLLLTLGLCRPGLLRVHRRDWSFFLLFGVVGVAGFYLAYIAAVSTGSVAQAAVLLYTAPFWIMAWTVLAEGEHVTGRKATALALAFAGCALVAGIAQPNGRSGQFSAVLWGLGAGLGYAVYSVCSAHGTRRGYRPVTVVTYPLVIGGALLGLASPWHDTVRIVQTPALWPALLGIALLPTLLAPLCFTMGLQSVPTANASIVATVEPVVAAGLGLVVLHEPLTLWQLIGGAAVLAAVIILTTTPVGPTIQSATPQPAHEESA